MTETKTPDHAQERPRSRRRRRRRPRRPSPRRATGSTSPWCAASCRARPRCGSCRRTPCSCSSRSRPGSRPRPCRCRSSCWNPAGWVETLEPGDEIVVVGRVRRRFFRAGGATASRVELEADVDARGRATAGGCRPRSGARTPRWRRSSSAGTGAFLSPEHRIAQEGAVQWTATGPIGGSARRRGRPTTCARAGGRHESAQQCAEPEKAEVNGDHRGEPDTSGGDTRPRRHSLRRRLRRRHAARRRPIHGAVGRVRQRPGDAAELPGRDPGTSRARSPACRRSRCTSRTTRSRHRATRPTCWSR